MYHSGVQCTDVKELCAKNVLPAMLSCANRSRHSPWDLIGKGSIRVQSMCSNGRIVCQTRSAWEACLTARQALDYFSHPVHSALI